MTDINLPDQERVADEMSARIIEKAGELWTLEMPGKGPLTDQPLRVQNVYMMAGREALLTDYIGGAETGPAEASNKLELVNNTPDMFVFAFRGGEEFLRIFRDNEGRVDVSIDPRLNYTEAASAFMQLIFQVSAKQQNLSFSRALELMRQGFRVEIHGGSSIYYIVDDCLFVTDRETEVSQPLTQMTDLLILSNDWQVVS